MDRLIEGITAPFDNFKSSLDNLFAPIESLLEFVKSIKLFFDDMPSFTEFLFVPDPEMLATNVVNLRTKFGLVDMFMGAGEWLLDQFVIMQGGVPPTLSFTISKTKGRYTFEETEIVLDFEWYAPYKEYVDTFLGAVIWVCFIYRMYKRLPDIIAGAGMVTEIVPDDTRGLEPKTGIRRRRKGG